MIATHAARWADALERVAQVSGAEVDPVDLASLFEVIAALRESLRGEAAPSVVFEVQGEAHEAGDARAVTFMLTGAGRDVLREAAAVFRGPWEVDGRELVDVQGSRVFAAAPGERGELRDVLLSVLAAAANAAVGGDRG